MQRKFLGLALISGLLLSAPLFAEGGSFNGLSVGVTLGLNPNYYQANENVSANGDPFAHVNEASYAGAEVNGMSGLGMPYAGYDGTNGLMGWNIGLVARYGLSDNMFLRLGINYSRTLMGNTIKPSFNAGAAGTPEATVSISASNLSFPITFGLGTSAGKAKLFAGIGPTFFMGSMNRKVEVNDAMNTAMIGVLGSDRVGEVDYSTGFAYGVHWIIGAEYELSPILNLVIDIMTTYGGKVVTETKTAGADTAVDLGFADYISNANASNSGGDKKAFTQTLNISGSRINIGVTYKVM
jgi:hypothetical protein